MIHMTGKLSFLLLLSVSICAAQAPMATLGAGTQSSQSSSPLGGIASPKGSQPLPSAEESNPTDMSPTKVESEEAPSSMSNLTKKKNSEDKKETEKEETEEAPNSTRKIVRNPAHSEFELFVQQAVGQPLGVFGRGFFEGGLSTFAPLSNIPVPADYAIGPGDELVIRAWGKIDIDTTVTVDRNGQIHLPKVGPVNVVGLRYQQLDACLRAAIGTIYKGFELNVTLGRLRSIQIYVLGSANQPGQFTVSSLSTLLDALHASGGPSNTGTMRHIQLQRAGKLVTEIDIYDVLRKGDKSRDAQLLPGDVIFIPVIGPQIAIAGSVNSPGIYELKGETTVASAIDEASGLTALATTGGVLLERVENRKVRRVDEFALDEAGLKRPLKDADLLKISPISPKFENAVMIRGNVTSPGRFPWHEGMRVSDLIPTRDALITNEHWNLQNSAAGGGAPNVMADVASRSAEINWAYATVERLDERDFSTRLIPFNLGNAIDNPASADNQALKIGDIVTIFSRRDLPLPVEQHQGFVEIGGEVNAAGVYRIQPGDTLRNLVRRAGGLTEHSYLYGAVFSRATVRAIEEADLQLSLQKLEEDLTDRQLKEGESPRRAAGDQALIARMSAIHAIGRVVLNIKPAAKAIEDIPDIPLEDGDSFTVPARLSTVQVIGEVTNPAAFQFDPARHLKMYLYDAGGAKRDADFKRSFLIHANGTVISRQTRSRRWGGNFESLAMMPGDAIVVPPILKTKIKGTSFVDQLPMIAQIFTSAALTGLVADLAVTK
jgi:polysaccharide export outer membrane protein